MKNLILTLFLVLLVGCASTPAEPAPADESNIDINSKQVAAKVEEMKENLDQNQKEEIEAVQEQAKEKIAKLQEGDIPDDWCTKGYTFEHEQEGVQIAANIQGMSSYKGQEFCKGIHSQEMQGLQIDTTYYFNYGAQEMWVISTVMGQTTEVHIVDGEVVA